jgi:hypothetical protein
VPANTPTIPTVQFRGRTLKKWKIYLHNIEISSALRKPNISEINSR